jgi:phospholipid/cholesterol/gamma-HCH transport system substrate-binding protein
VGAAIPVGFKLHDPHATYFASFTGESLSGLEQGGIVKYHGIPIGKVEDINYDPRHIDQVRVKLRIRKDFPVKTDMFAQTGMMGITGLMYLEIMGGSDTSAMLATGGEIRTQRSMMATITGKAEVIIAKIELLINQLNVVTNPDSLSSIKRILDNVAVITGDARSFLDNVRPNIELMASSAQHVLTSTDSIAQDIRAVTADVRKGVASGQISEILSSIDSTSAALRQLSMNLSLTIRQGREDISVALQNIREASENANELTKILAENPSLLIRGEQQQERRIK